MENLVNMTRSSPPLNSLVVRASERWTGGHGFDSHLGLRAQLHKATLDKVGISATIPCVPEDFVAISNAIVDKSVEGGLKSIRNTMRVEKKSSGKQETVTEIFT